VAQRVRRQIVDGVSRTIPVQINDAIRRTTIKRIPGVPVGGGGAEYSIGATTSLERDGATSQVYLLRAGPISGHYNRLAAQIKSGTTAREIVERDAFKTREGRQLIDPEGAAAIERQRIGARSPVRLSPA
jgi:hypothetical protein